MENQERIITAIKRGIAESFPGHKGRPGQRGGSLPKGSGSGGGGDVTGSPEEIMDKLDAAGWGDVENFELDVVGKKTVTHKGKKRELSLQGDGTGKTWAFTAYLDSGGNTPLHKSLGAKILTPDQTLKLFN